MGIRWKKLKGLVIKDTEEDKKYKEIYDKQYKKSRAAHIEASARKDAKERAVGGNINRTFSWMEKKLRDRNTRAKESERRARYRSRKHKKKKGRKRNRKKRYYGREKRGFDSWDVW